MRTTNTIKSQESNLIRFFGGNPFIKMLDAFIENIRSGYTKKEIQDLSGISKATLFKYWPKLEELGLVKVMRAFGNTKLYTLDKENKTVKALLKLETDLIEATSPKEKKKEKRVKELENPRKKVKEEF